MTLSTHVLDTATGRPAAGVPVTVSRFADGKWVVVADALTDADGRCGRLLGEDAWGAGLWRVVFDTSAYLGADAFFPSVSVEFAVLDPTHHHVPLLLSPFGYSTYRGS